MVITVPCFVTANPVPCWTLPCPCPMLFWGRKGAAVAGADLHCTIGLCCADPESCS